MRIKTPSARASTLECGDLSPLFTQATCRRLIPRDSAFTTNAELRSVVRRSSNAPLNAARLGRQVAQAGKAAIGRSTPGTASLSDDLDYEDVGLRLNSPPDRRDACPTNAAFTLIEVVISAGLMALILVASYLCLNAGIKGKQLVEPRADIIQNARVAMNIMAADLRGACALGKDYQFIGVRRLVGEMEADNLDFATHNYTPRRPLEGDFCQASFYVDRDPETGNFSLWRRRNPVIATDPLAGGSKEEIAKGVVGVRFEYTDGFDWYDTWGETNPRKRDAAATAEPNMIGMPEAVRITLMLDSNPKAKKLSGDATVAAAEQPPAEPPLVFTTVARLNLAASSMRATTGATTASPEGAGADAQGGGVQR